MNGRLGTGNGSVARAFFRRQQRPLIGRKLNVKIPFPRRARAIKTATKRSAHTIVPVTVHFGHGVFKFWGNSPRKHRS